MFIVSEALVRYVNQGVTLGSVNLPEVNLRSLTLDEPNHARVSCSKSLQIRGHNEDMQVIYIHHNIPGVLKKGEPLTNELARGMITNSL